MPNFRYDPRHEMTAAEHAEIISRRDDPDGMFWCALANQNERNERRKNPQSDLDQNDGHVNEG